MSRHRARPPSAWMADAACLGVPGLPWTTDTHDRTGPAVLGQIMAETCAACPVRTECAAYANANANDITGGFWAGRDRALPPKPRARRRVAWVPIPGTDGRVIEEPGVLFPEAGDAA